MYSVAFPNMLSGSQTLLVKNKESTMSDLKLVLGSTKTSLLGDPYFGTNLKKFLYANNDVIIKDLIIDEIYSSIVQFMPHVYLQRDDITVVQEHQNIYVTVKCIHTYNNESNLYSINLTTE